MKLRAMITGSDGFIGRHFNEHFMSLGWETNICDTAYEWGVEKMIAATEAHRVKPYDLVVHAAAVGPNRVAIDRRPETHIRNSLLDALVFDWVVRTGQGRLLYFSSSAIYSDDVRHPVLGGGVSAMSIRFREEDGFAHEPFDDYGRTKRHGEIMAAAARRAGAKVTVVRPFSGYGEDQSADFPFGAFVARAKRRDDPFSIWGSPGQVRDWVHVDDIVAACMAIIESDTEEPVNICTGLGITMDRLQRLVCDAVDYDPRVESVLTAPQGVLHRVGDPTRLRRYYTPRITLEEGVRRALKGA